jgi:peroxiredoxin
MGLGESISKNTMNRAKSIFISSASMVWTYFTYIFVRDIVANGYSLSGLGLFFVSLLPLAFFMVLLALRPVARTSRSLHVFTTLIFVGLVLISADIYQGNGSILYMTVAVISLNLWLLYVYWYSILPASRKEIKVGSSLPKLTFTDNKGEPVSSSDFAGKKVLYMFYRGNWCPLCVAQIREISAQYQELERLGVEVLLISPQPVSHSVTLAKKMKVNFHFLTDVNNAMARQLKIDQDHGIPLGLEVLGYKSETVLPTVIITDERGKILFLDQTDNYRVRPEPETFFEVLDA